MPPISEIIYAPLSSDKFDEIPALRAYMYVLRLQGDAFEYLLKFYSQTVSEALKDFIPNYDPYYTEFRCAPYIFPPMALTISQKSTVTDDTVRKNVQAAIEDSKRFFNYFNAMYTVHRKVNQVISQWAKRSKIEAPLESWGSLVMLNDFLEKAGVPTHSLIDVNKLDNSRAATEIQYQTLPDIPELDKLIHKVQPKLELLREQAYLQSLI